MNISGAAGAVQAEETDLAGSLRQILPRNETTPSTENGLKSRNSFISTNSTIEDSQPPSPEYGPPNNFGEVIPGVYRSSFPREPNFDHLAQLGLKTILTLVSEKEDPQYLKFIRSHSIKHHQIPIPPNKEAFDAIPITAMTEALSIVCDSRNHPMLIHCNKGKHRTGCVIGCYRKMNDWKAGEVIKEYRQYAGEKARSLDEKYIADFDQYGMAMRLDDLVYRMARESCALLTPPSSDSSYKESNIKVEENVPHSVPPYQ